MPSEVQRVHTRMLRAMGGPAAWEDARYFEFDYVMLRAGRETARWSYRWDRPTGQYWLSGVRGADSVVIISTRPVNYEWGGWQNVAGLTLSTEKAVADRSVIIRFEYLCVSKETPDLAFLFCHTRILPPSTVC